MDRRRVPTYSLLVEHENVPPWPPTPIKAVGMRRNLYTSVMSGEESDAIEQWLNREIETPAQRAIDKVLNGEVLSGDDRRRLTRFAMAMHVRTPMDYIETRDRWLKEMPTNTESFLDDLPRSLANPEPENLHGPQGPRPALQGAPLRVRIEQDPETGNMVVGVEWIIGRELWLARMRHILSETINIIPDHNWVVLRPSPETEWFTSDVPLLRLNYYEPGRYDFNGGWGSPGTELMLPLSPRHLLYCQIERSERKGGACSRLATFRMQQILAERAFREVYATQGVRRVEWWRPRRVDREMYRAEQRMWVEWHDEQSKPHQSVSPEGQ